MVKRVLFIGFVLFILFLSGCAKQTVTKQPSELILDLSDLPEGFSIKERTPRLKSDVSQEGIDLGWQEGYYIRYARIAEDIFDSTVIEQSISVYPTENIAKVLEVPYESNENRIYEELPSPNIGDKSKAYRITFTDEFGNTGRYYSIEFIKMNIFESFDMSGTTTDYESLKLLVKKAESKIR